MTVESYYVLESNPNDSVFVNVLIRTIDAAGEVGMMFDLPGRDNLSVDLTRLTFRERTGRAQIILVDDSTATVRYLIVAAESIPDAKKLTIWLSKRLPFRSLASLQADARRVVGSDPEALVRLALGTSATSDPETLAIFRDGMRSPEPLVRFRAAEAASLTRWPDLRSDLEQLQVNDPSPEVREIARRGLTTLGWSS